MPYSNQQLKEIYDRTSGYCHICGKKVAFTNYGSSGYKGAWEVDHSNPRAKGGSDRLNNLYAACISCNRDKLTASTHTARGWYGQERAPLSRQKRRQARIGNAIAGGMVGYFVGALAGPAWPVIGAVVGAGLGYRGKPDSF